jgi:hypothetical protein
MTLPEITACGMCVRAQTSALGIRYRFDYLKGEESRRESKVEITNSSSAEKDRQPQQGLMKFQAAEGSFRQPTSAEISVLTFCKLRYARSHAQELSNEFARLLNRGSSLE